MRSRTSFLIALCALAICLSCQVAEIFDQWDHTAQTGSDTEYTFVVLTLCVGVAYSLKWFAPEISLPQTRTPAAFRPRLDSLFAAFIPQAPPVLTPASPPVISLRI
ncbi:MAG TPA: hypothetical protein VNZ63_13320 [Verrucomicrobiae bacterium]|nr:hypothetical protein [Verrucomicrobiae bacterium]